jgi:hypothetical protein
MSNKHSLAPGDILPMEQYGPIRAESRRRVAAQKRNRRVEVGPDVTFYFENYDTMWLQVHEMVYIEKGGAEQVRGELEAYNPLIPNGRELVATFMVEIDDPVRRKNILGQLGGIEETALFMIDGERIKGAAEQDTDRTTAEGKASSVQFVHFPFTAARVERSRARRAGDPGLHATATWRCCPKRRGQNWRRISIERYAGRRRSEQSFAGLRLAPNVLRCIGRAFGVKGRPSGLPIGCDTHPHIDGPTIQNCLIATSVRLRHAGCHQGGAPSQAFGDFMGFFAAQPGVRENAKRAAGQTARRGPCGGGRKPTRRHHRPDAGDRYQPQPGQKARKPTDRCTDFGTRRRRPDALVARDDADVALRHPGFLKRLNRVRSCGVVLVQTHDRDDHCGALRVSRHACKATPSGAQLNGDSGMMPRRPVSLLVDSRCRGVRSDGRPIPAKYEVSANA